MPRSRHQSTTLRRCSTGSTRRSGSTGEFSHSSAGRLRAERGQRVGRDGAGAGEHRAHLVRRVGQRGVGDQVARRRCRGGRHRGDQLLGADHRQHRVQAEAGRRRAAGRASPGTPAGCRPARSSSGSPASRPPRTARAARPRASGRRACRPRGRRCRRGAPRAVAACAVRWSQGKSGSRRRDRGRRGRRAQESWFCGGRAATNGWSLSISPILAAPPGEPRSSKKPTLAV